MLSRVVACRRFYGLQHYRVAFLIDSHIDKRLARFVFKHLRDALSRLCRYRADAARLKPAELNGDPAADLLANLQRHNLCDQAREYLPVDRPAACALNKPAR